MPRPKKDPKALKGEILRIPVSTAEKTYLYEAAVSTEGEFAKWARPILLKAAGDWHRAQAGRGKKPQKRTIAANEKAGASNP